MPTCVELFAGAGGAGVGLHRAGFTSLLAVEWDKEAHATLAASGVSERAVCGDVRNAALYDGLEGQVDLVWASPPCQSWSTAGLRLGASDERNGWPWTFDIVERLQPRYVLCENVTGMGYHLASCPVRRAPPPSMTAGVNAFALFGDEDLPPEVANYTPGLSPEECPGCYWTKVVIPWFQARFPRTIAKVILSADYGVPQRRERVIIMAGSAELAWPTPTHSRGALNESKRAGTYWRRHGIATPPTRGARVEGASGDGQADFHGAPWVTVRDVFSTLPPEPAGYDSLWVKDHQVARTVRFRGTDLIEMDPDLPSDTVTCRRSGSKTNDALIWRDGDRLRYLTIPEVAALQSFPAAHPWQGSKSARYKQIGNAVPPPVAEALGRAVLAAMR